LWDFAGQKQYHNLWNTLIKGSDAVLIVTDSTMENVEKSKKFTNFIEEEAPFAEYAIIANKQDLEEALKPLKIKNMLGNGAKVYPMIAIDQSNREKMIEIMADMLRINTEISPLLKPLFARDTLIDEAEKALKEGYLDIAMEKFHEISKLSYHLEEYDIAKMVEEKAKKIEHILSFIEAEEAYNQDLQEDIEETTENHVQYDLKALTDDDQIALSEHDIEDFIEDISKIKKTDEKKRKEIITDLKNLNRPPKSKNEELKDEIDRMIREADDLRKRLFRT
jgi:GTPase SAR1 family protein